MSRIIGMTVMDVRFPTSRDADGSDAMNESPDYSAAYVELDTDADDGNRGVGFVFTIGRGNDVQCAAIEALRPMVVGRDVEASLTDMGATWREFVHDSQLRWLGPEKGVAHMAIGAVVNALWDLRAKREGQPLWRLLAGLDPEQIVDLVDFRYLTDAITPDEALSLLRAAVPGRGERLARLEAVGYPAYTTTPGWLGYDDAKLDRLCREAVADGFEQIKLKVGGDLEDDVRRLGIARAAIGPDVRLAIDANQRWDVEEAVRWVRRLQPFDLAWIEEPTSPDDILGHATIAHAVAPTPVATGEHMANRVVAKQLIQAGAAEVLQIDATRVAGVNENIAILLLAAKHGVRVCPHAGGVGLCEAVQHLSMFDAVAVSGRLDDRCIEFVDHLHEHFRTPVVVRGGRYVAPSAPGAGTEMWPESVRRFTFPHGPEWAPSAVDASTAPARHVVVRTRLRRGEESRYEALHATIPDALADRLRAAGVSQWRIHRDGVDLIHVIDVADHRAMRTALAGDPVNVAWQELVNPLLEQPDDYSGQDDGLPLVWSLR